MHTSLHGDWSSDVCFSYLLESGEWIRTYPVPLSFLLGQRKSGKMESFKYTWIELELNKRTDDFRSESYSPKYYDFRRSEERRVGKDGSYEDMRQDERKIIN